MGGLTRSEMKRARYTMWKTRYSALYSHEQDEDSFAVFCATWRTNENLLGTVDLPVLGVLGWHTAVSKNKTGRLDKTIKGPGCENPGEEEKVALAPQI